MTSRYSCTVDHYMAHARLQTEWSAAKGTPGYVKADWMERSRLLHVGCAGGCLASPPPLPKKGWTMTTKLTPRQAMDHPFLITLLSGSRAKRGKAFERVMDTLHAQGPGHTYDVEVSVNGVALDFADFTDEVQRQLDEMVMRAARKLFDEQFADRFQEIAEQTYAAERAAKDLRNALEAEARKAWGMPPAPEEDDR